MYNYDHQTFYPRGEKNGRLKNQMTASGDVMTMRSARLCLTPEVPATPENQTAATGHTDVVRQYLLRITNK